jgi:hypothetical protein
MIDFTNNQKKNYILQNAGSNILNFNNNNNNQIHENENKNKNNENGNSLFITRRKSYNLIREKTPKEIFEEQIKKKTLLENLQQQIMINKNSKINEIQRKKAEDQKYLKDIDSYFPFGKNGAGAPLRDSIGNLITKKKSLISIFNDFNNNNNINNNNKINENKNNILPNISQKITIRENIIPINDNFLEANLHKINNNNNNNIFRPSFSMPQSALNNLINDNKNNNSLSISDILNLNNLNNNNNINNNTGINSYINDSYINFIKNLQQNQNQNSIELQRINSASGNYNYNTNKNNINNNNNNNSTDSYISGTQMPLYNELNTNSNTNPNNNNNNIYSSENLINNNNMLGGFLSEKKKRNSEDYMKILLEQIEFKKGKFL